MHEPFPVIAPSW